ncbi:tetratricopeptide repeat protein [Magnetospirillum sp. 15-1]|uniref:tetratricopeptide repeat protein n=1 Tax=Magnetospirillum sp. 15-1 TaxID=1979370 RepID=UPI000BBB9494|nr:tetratricopeptide repeat protein [Magnetospirillum sp. 15-1]
MSEIEDLDLEFADISEHAAIIETLWQEAIVARRYGDTEPALDAYRRIIDLDPSHSEARLAAAETCRLAGKPRDALRFCLDLLEMDRQHVGCRLELAEALRQLRQPDEAHAIIDILLMERPDSVHVWCGLSRLLADEERLPGAEATLRRALRLHPGYGPAWAALGRVLARRGEGEAALDAFHAAIILDPEQPAHRVGLAETLIDQGRVDEAAEHMDRALALDDEDAAAHMARARLLMLNGRLAESWEDAQWRHRLPGAARPHFPGAPWEGQDLEGTHLLLHAESGLSETLMMARFIPVLAERCAHITLVVQPELAPLLETLPGVARVLPLDLPLPDGFIADYAASLDDLPGLLEVGILSIPAAPYLAPPPHRIRRIRVPAATQLKVGIAWAGDRPEDCIAFARILDLTTVPGTLLFSLQTGPKAAEARLRADPGLITDLSPTVSDFADLAGRIAEMDMVVATDGPVAHLAAAMGKPVLLLLPHTAHERWMRRRDDSPWYPEMFLLRQPAPGRWEAPLAEVRRRMEMLAQLTAERYEQQRRRAMGGDAAMQAFLAAHLAPGDLLVDVGAGSGRHLFEAQEQCGHQLLVIALEPSPGEAAMLRDSIAIAGLEEQVEVIAAAAGAESGHVLASRQMRGGARVFALPDWVPTATPLVPLGRLLDERPQLAECRVVVRVDQPGWEDGIVAGLAGRAAIVTLEHREGSAAADRLAEAGYSLWRFAEDVACGAPVPFDGRPGPVLALAPGIAPAAHYGPPSLPPSSEQIGAEAERAVHMAQPGPALQAAGQVTEAARLYGQALAIDPFCPMANANLAVLQHMAGKPGAAIASFTRSVEISRHPAVMSNLAGVLRLAGRLDEADALLSEILAADSDNAELLHDLALLRRDQGRLGDAEALMRRVRALTPDHPGYDWALAQILLGAGNLAEGLPLLARRPAPPSRAPELPEWDGGDVVATPLLVEVTGDLADSVLLARFLPLLAGKGALVTLACPDELAALLADLPGIEQVAGEDDPLPPCRMRTSLAALPGLLGVADAARPSGSGGYLVAGRGRRSMRDTRLRVGLTWGGRRGEAGCPLGDMLVLGIDPAFSLLALADEVHLERIEAEGADALVERPIPQPADLAEMAALISGVDVVVGSDTVQLHLAAALGKPVMALLPHGFDWRWPEGREDSPWYASVRVFRPDPAGGWRVPLRRVAQALAIMAERKAHL